MAIIARDNGSVDYKPAPEGLHQAVCVDVVDKGIHRSEYQGKTKEQHKVEIRWQLEDRFETEEGERPFMVVQWYTNSLSAKAKLREHLEAWRGKAFTAAELEGFDLEKLLGANCQLLITHSEPKNGRVYANVKAIMPVKKGTPLLEPEDYIRVCDREPDPATQAEDYDPFGPDNDWGDDEDLPF